MGLRQVVLEPLTRKAFAPFGTVIETAGVAPRLINGGTTEKFGDLAQVDVATDSGRPQISIFRGQPFKLPLRIRMVERHPLGSQAFIPLNERPFVIVVAAGAGTPKAEKVRAFLTDGKQGVNYARNVWHHPLISLGAVSDFAIVDRCGPGLNLEEFWFDDGEQVVIAME